jgi:hypothetical protein
MKTILASIIASFFASAAADELTGRWESSPSVNGNVTGVVFKEDNTFEGYINKKPFVSGTYSYSGEDSVFTFQDNGCNGATWRLQNTFFQQFRFFAFYST